MSGVARLVLRWSAVADFLLVYISEAHATDGWRLGSVVTTRRQHRSLGAPPLSPYKPTHTTTHTHKHAPAHARTISKPPACSPANGGHCLCTGMLCVFGRLIYRNCHFI